MKIVVALDVTDDSEEMGVDIDSYMEAVGDHVKEAFDGTRGRRSTDNPLPEWNKTLVTGCSVTVLP